MRLAGHIRALSGMDLEDGVSTRLLICAASLMADGMSLDRALHAAGMRANLRNMLGAAGADPGRGADLSRDAAADCLDFEEPGEET